MIKNFDKFDQKNPQTHKLPISKKKKRDSTADLTDIKKGHYYQPVSINSTMRQNGQISQDLNSHQEIGNVITPHYKN